MSFVLKNKIPQLNDQLKRRTSALVVKTAAQIVTNAKISMTGPKSGAVYKIRGVEHQASAPGEAPAVETSALINSIDFVKETDTRAIVGTNMEYAPVLEFGGVHMAPRPWLGPAFAAAEDGFRKGLQELIK